MLVAQYKDALNFNDMEEDLDPTIALTLAKGSRLISLFKQDDYSPMETSAQFVILFGVSQGLFNDIEVSQMSELEAFILEKLKVVDFFDFDAPIETIHAQTTASLLDLLDE